MPRVRIDGTEVDVPAGATILDAAGACGVTIPTLCHVEGLVHDAACMICVVAVDGRADLVPACAHPAEDGLVVWTDTVPVREARRVALELLLSDHLGECEGPCALGCPAGLDAPGMLRLLEQGEAGLAARVARSSVPLCASLGYICARFCEQSCRRRELDRPLAIREAHRLAGEEAFAAGFVDERLPDSGRTIAVVGAGPSGLGAAYFLRRRGHAVTVLEARSEPGGVLAHTIPDFRLPARVVTAEVASILATGISLRTGAALGSAADLAWLRREHDAVLVATGAPCHRPSSLPGGEHAIPAMEFLRAVRRGDPPAPGELAVVLGNDTAASDAARSARRLGWLEVVHVLQGSPDRACLHDGLLAAEAAEGVTVEYDARNVRIELADGCLEVRRSDRAPHRAACVIASSGRRVDGELARAQGLALTLRGIRIDPSTFETSVPGVFAAGEAVSGPVAGVRAVASGRAAALAIDRFLAGRPHPSPIRRFSSRLRRLTPLLKAELLARARVPAVPGAAAAVPEGGVAPAVVIARSELAGEAARCLSCDCAAKEECTLRDLATEYGARQERFHGERRHPVRDDSHPDVLFDSGKCVLCGACVRVASDRHETRGITFWSRGLQTRLGGAFEESLSVALVRSALDCARACPTGALVARDPTRPGGHPAPAADRERSPLPSRDDRG